VANVTDDRIFDRFQLIVNGPALFNAIVAGYELNVFGNLSLTGGLDLEALVERIGIPRPQLRALMFALCSTELISRRDGIYRNSDLAEAFFVLDGPESWKHILSGWQRIYYPAFQHLTASMREGRNVALDLLPGEGETLYQRLAVDPELEGILHRAMSAFTLQSMGGLLDNVDLAATRHLLDVGGGDGTTAMALVRHNTHLRITILDVPTVAALANGETSEATRICIVPGDFFEASFPADVDGVLFSHVLEIFDEHQIRTLLKKAFDVLPSGGKVMIYGFLSSEDETSGVFGARLALYLNVLASGRGMAYSAHDYESAMRDVGFLNVSTITDLPYEHGLTTGHRP